MTTIELRRLALADLLAIEEIERRSYPTPWSRSMFAGELAKPSSICLGAFEADDVRRGYTLEVRVSNETAIALYERLGFESRGIRRGYYTDNREDALIMWKDPVGRDSA